MPVCAANIRKRQPHEILSHHCTESKLIVLVHCITVRTLSFRRLSISCLCAASSCSTQGSEPQSSRRAVSYCLVLHRDEVLEGGQLAFQPFARGIGRKQSTQSKSQVKLTLWASWPHPRIPRVVSSLTVSQSHSPLRLAVDLV